MNAKQIISELNARGAKFVVNTNIMYGRGINGIGFDSYIQNEELSSGMKVYRTFEPNDDCLVITERYEPGEPIYASKQKPYTRKKYLDYNKITYITEIVED